MLGLGGFFFGYFARFKWPAPEKRTTLAFQPITNNLKVFGKERRVGALAGVSAAHVVRAVVSGIKFSAPSHALHAGFGPGLVLGPEALSFNHGASRDPSRPVEDFAWPFPKALSSEDFEAARPAAQVRATAPSSPAHARCIRRSSVPLQRHLCAASWVSLGVQLRFLANTLAAT